MSFKENFERGGGDDSLDYDDSAFYYFFLALLLIMLIPATWTFVLRPVLFGDFSINSSLKNCQCKVCQERMRKREKANSMSWLNGWFVIRLLLIIIFWYAAYVCFDAVKDLEPLKQFIPHEILGIQPDATPAQAKKAYRKLSREKHPDKNPDNPEAVNEFIQITKAYTIMTDEKARDNFIKYGNPDGKGSFAVGIALPQFLQKKDFQLQVLLAFFIIVIVVIPYWFYTKLEESQVDVGGIDLETRKMFTDLIDENIELKRMPGILQFSSEFQGMRVRSKDEVALLKTLREDDKIKAYIPKMSNSKLPEIQVKPIVLLAGYMHGVLTEEHLKVGSLERDLERMLKSIPHLLDILLEQTLLLNTLFRQGRSPRRILAKNVLTIVQFQQNLFAGTNINKDPYSQLPGFGEAECRRVQQLMNKQNLDAYAKKTRAEREAMAEEIFGHPKGSAELKEKFEQQEECIAALPVVKLTMTAEVEGEEEIVVGDILTCKLKVEFLNLQPGQRTGYVHSKHYPYLKRDSWHLVITDDSLMGLAACDKIVTMDSVFTKEFKERVQRPGPISFTAILTNDSYRGIDQVQKIKVDVKAQATNRTYVEYLKSDLKAIRQPTQLQMGLTGGDESSSDSEGHANEEEELEAKLRNAGIIKDSTAKKDD